MIIEPKEKRSYTIDFKNNQLTITIPFKKDYYVIAIMITTWIIGIILFYDVIWILLGLPMLFAVTNILFGKEEIHLNKQYLTRNFAIKNITLDSKKYYIPNIRNIRINQKDNRDSNYINDLEIRLYGPEVGRISFDYGKNTIKIVGDIKKNEEIDIIDLIKKHISH
jgi:hypothetical protein